MVLFMPQNLARWKFTADWIAEKDAEQYKNGSFLSLFQMAEVS